MVSTSHMKLIAGLVTALMTDVSGDVNRAIDPFDNHVTGKFGIDDYGDAIDYIVTLRQRLAGLLEGSLK